MPDKVSIVVPIYNVEKYLRQCLESIVNQTYRNLEIILVDDGSPDKCGMICDEYGQKDSRFIVVHQENQGVSVARNVGIEMATGEWIMFVDPDDWLELDCCEKVMECAFRKHWDIVYFQRRDNNEAGFPVWEYPKIGSFQLDYEKIKKMQEDCLTGRQCSSGFDDTAPWGKLYCLQTLKKYNCKFPVGLKRRQDLIFHFYFQDCIEQAYFLDHVGYNYRINASSICRRYNVEMLDILLMFLREMEIFIHRNHNNDERYLKFLGIQTINILGDINITMFFHSTGRMNYSEYCRYMERYYNNDVVKRYMVKCSFNDFKTIRRKVNYLLIRNHCVFLYYVVAFIYQYMRRYKEF